MIERLNAALSGRYRIERELGAGGMATVYLAEDLKHDRKVALKVLKPELTAVLGGDRFIQEIKTTAQLQHPHILPLFDSGTADGFLFYVMPYIDGETLRDKLDRETQLGIDEAVRITREVADALDYAHRHGIIHRDIKPENILLHDGRPVVADFGIALAVSAAAGGRMTETGTSVGTPHYMSPEQATGDKQVTGRADIYSLASMLYEMLSGEPPHTGASAQAVIMKIIADTPRPVTELRRSVPPNVAAAVMMGLEKLPADRFESAKAFADALANAAFVGTATTAGSAPGSFVSASRHSGAVLALTALTILAAALAAWGWLRPAPTPTVLRYGLALPASQALDPGAPVPEPAPDGSFFVYHGPLEAGGEGTQLWIKRRDSYTATPIAGTAGAQSYAISPDGEWIAFATGDDLVKLPISGGAAVTLVSEGVAPMRGVAWLDDGTIVYSLAAPFGLARVPAAGGPATEVWASGEWSSQSPTPIPGGRGVFFTVCTPYCDLWVLDLRADTARVVIGGADVEVGRYVPTGHVVYVQADGALLAAPFDLERLEVRGAPVAILERVRVGSAYGSTLAVSASGTLLLRLGEPADSRRYEMVWVDREGLQTPVDTSWTFSLTVYAQNEGWALSADGTRLAVGLFTDAGDDIWVKQLPRGPLSRISYDAAPDYRPRWTRDGRFITFGSNREHAGLYQRRADGTGTDSLLLAGQVSEGLWSPDRSWLLLRVGGTLPTAGGRDIVGLRPGIDSAAVPVLATPFDEEAVALSPDGRWLAYQSDETGRTEVFIRPFPDTDAGKWQVSRDGGHAPLWARDGGELYYVDGEQNMSAVSVTTGEALILGEPQVLFRIPDDLLTVQFNYYTPWDVGPDGRFIMARLTGSAAAAELPLIVVENWFEELKARMPK